MLIYLRPYGYMVVSLWFHACVLMLSHLCPYKKGGKEEEEASAESIENLRKSAQPVRQSIHKTGGEDDKEDEEEDDQEEEEKVFFLDFHSTMLILLCVFEIIIKKVIMLLCVFDIGASKVLCFTKVTFRDRMFSFSF